MPMHLIPLTSKVEALTEILDVQDSHDRRKILLRLADGLLLLLRWKTAFTRDNWREASKDGQFESISLISTQDSFLVYGFFRVCPDEDPSEREEVIFTYSSGRQLATWSSSDGVQYKSVEMGLNYPLTAMESTSSGKYALCSFPPMILVVLDLSTLMVSSKQNLDYWIVKMKILKKIADTIDQFMVVTSLNEVIIAHFNQSDLSWTLKARTIPVDPRGSGVQVLIETCEADDSLFAVSFDDIVALYQVTPMHLVCLERLSVIGPCVKSMKFYGSSYVAASTSEALSIIKVPDSQSFKNEESNTNNPDLILFDFMEPSCVADMFSIPRKTTSDVNCGSFDFIFPDAERSAYALISTRISSTSSNKVVLSSDVEIFLLKKCDESLELYSTDDAFCATDELKFDLWLPFGPDETEVSPCFAIIAPNNKLILSYPNGIMVCMSLEQVAMQFVGDHIPSKVDVLSAPDLGKVVAMHCTNTKDQTTLFTGNSHGTIHIWCLEKLKLTNTFYVHSEAVLCFFLIPSEGSIRVKTLLVSISSDNLVAVFSLNPISYLYTLTGHDNRISKLHWHESEELLAIETTIGSISIWQLRTGYLDRKVNAYEARDIVHQFNWSISCKYLMSHKPNSGSAFSVDIIRGNTPSDYLFIFLVIDTIKLSYVVYSQHAKTQDFEESQENDSSTQPRKWDMMPPFNINTTCAILSKFLEMHEDDPIAHLLNKSIPGFPTTKGIPEMTKLPYSIDEFKMESSFMLSSFNKSSELVWTTSPKLTAARILEIMLIKCTLEAINGNDIPENLSEKLAVIIPKIGQKIGPAFCPPLIEYLVKYWFGPPGIPQTTIRRVFKGVLYSMPQEKIDHIIKRCFSNIPSASGVISETALHSLFLLSVIARVNIKLLDDAKPIARDLVSLAGRNNSRVYRILAIELLGYDSNVWTKLIDGSIIFDVLFSISGLKDESYMSAFRGLSSKIITDRQYEQAGRADNKINDPLNSGFATLPQMSPRTRMKTAKATAYSRLVPSGNTPEVTFDRKELFPTFSLFHLRTQSDLQEITLASLVYFASVNSNLFVNILVETLSNSPDPLVSAGGFRLLGILLHKTPLVLCRHIPQLVNVMVKSMDPNQIHTSSIVRKIVAANLSEITMVFPSAAFSLATQRLMVGVQDGSLVIYDVRTATRVQVIEAHLMPVTAAAFSPDGRLIVSYSLEENVVRFWQATGGGFLNSLMGALGPNLSYSNQDLNSQDTEGSGFGVPHIGPSAMVGQMRLFRAFVLGKRQDAVCSLMDIVQKTRFNWMSNRCVVLTGPNNLEMFFNV